MEIEMFPQTLPQIRIDDVEARSCLNATAIICPNNLRLIIICRLGTCARSICKIATMTRRQHIWGTVRRTAAEHHGLRI
jgi:hypothetical protein